MSRGFLGRAVAGAGVVAGLLSLGLPLTTAGGVTTRYVDDGTAFAFLLVLLCLAAYLPAEVEGRASAAAGAAALGFALFQPAAGGFDGLGAGAWLALSTALIPLGGLLARERSEQPARQTGRSPFPAASVLGAAGLALVFAGVWLPAQRDGATFWGLPSSGHALGILLLLAPCLAAGLVLAAALTRSDLLAQGAFLTAAAAFGLVETPVIRAAFEAFDSLGSGAWVAAAGGPALVAAVLRGAVRPPAGAQSAGAGCPTS